MKYRKKPVEVEAFRYDGDLIDSDGKPCVPAWAIDAYDSGFMYFDTPLVDMNRWTLYIITPEGVRCVEVGDYIVKGARGIYPKKRETFEANYERVRT